MEVGLGVVLGVVLGVALEVELAGVGLGVGLGVALEVMGSEEAVWAACSAFSCRSVPACRMADKKPAGRGRGVGVGVSVLGVSDFGGSGLGGSGLGVVVLDGSDFGGSGLGVSVLGGSGLGVSDLSDSDLGDSRREGRRASLGMGGGTVCGRHCTAFGGWYSSEMGANRVRPAGIGGGGGLAAFCGDFTG